VIHAVGVWAETAVKTRDMLKAVGIKAVALISVWTVYSDEKWTQLLGAFREASLPDFWFLSKLYLRARLLVRPVEARGMRAADLVLVNYNCIARDLRRSFGQGLRIRKISYATELAFGQPAPLLPAPNEHLPTGNGPLIVCLSRHDSRKGIDVLLRALGLLHRKGVPFRACITSAGPLLEHHRRLAAKLGILEQTTFPGWVADVRAYLQAADVFVLPSRAEQSGSVAMLEAMQLERCVVASACDGIPEDATHNHSALLAKPGDTRDLADQLETVLSDPALRARLAAAGRTVYETRFSAGAFTAELVTLYRELLATKEAPQGAN
jgi:glycosyltransferase involved in cell wall biosynthesis